MSKILVAFLAGIGLGLLIAPEKGNELRDRIKDWIDDAGDEARDTASRGLGRVEDAASDLDSRLRNAIK